MSLVQEALRDKPQAFWNLDDSSPFQDYSGYNRSGTATGAGTAHSVCAGCAYSPVFGRSALASFDSPVFKRGREADPFTLEAATLPIRKTSGETRTLATRTNYALNPNLGTDLSNIVGIGAAAGTTNRLSDAALTTGTVWYVRKVWDGVSAGGLGMGCMTGTMPVGTYTGSFWVRSGVTSINVYFEGTSTKVPYSASRTVVANTWTRVSLTFDVTVAGTVKVGGYITPAVAPNDYIEMTAFMLESGPNMTDYFDGSMPDYDYVGGISTTAEVARTNLVNDPHQDASTYTSPIRRNVAWSDSAQPRVLINGTLTTGVSYDGTTWTRATNTHASAVGSFRKEIALSSLQTNRQYVASWEVANDTAAPVSVNVDWCDGGQTNYTIQPKQRRVISATFSRAYDSTFRFTDLDVVTPNTSILFREISVELGTAYNPYFDGTTTPATYNLAKNCPVSLNGAAYGWSAVTDGRTDGALGGNVYGYIDSAGEVGNPKNVVVDLGSIKLLDQIKVWHYYADGRTYTDTKTQISVDGITWVTVFDSATSGTYAETAGGKTHSFTRQYARYIRDYANINSVNNNVHWSEIQAFDTASEYYFGWAGTAWQSEARYNAAQTNYWVHSIGGIAGGAVKMTEGGVTFNRFITPAYQQQAQWRLVFIYGQFHGLNPGDTVNLIFRARAGGGYRAGTTMAPAIMRGNGLGEAGPAGTGVSLTSSWQTFTRTLTVTKRPGYDAGVYLTYTTLATTEDSWVDFEYAGASTKPIPEIWTGDSAGAVWKGTQYNSASRMLTSTSEQQILGNPGQYDGLIINGTKVSFVTKYSNSGEARAEYDLQRVQNAVLHGVHTKEKNSLFVNGVRVAEADISPEQQADTYAALGGTLSSGETTSSSDLVIGGIGVYAAALSGEQVVRHATAARRVVPQNGVAASFGGTRIPLASDEADVFLRHTWDTEVDWKEATLDGTTVLDDRLVPQLEAGVSVASEWTDNFALASANTTSIFGVNFNWDGEGATIEASLDGTTWETVVRGKNLTIIPPGFDPTDKELLVRISFPGGITNDPSYVDNLEIIGFKTGVVPAVEGRTITLTGEAYLEREYPLISFNDNWGTELKGGTITIGAEVGPDAVAPKTIEIWAKGTFSTNISAPTILTNGTGGVNPTAGKWQMRTYIIPAGHAGSITITSADAQIGQVVLYDAELTTPQAAAIYNAYVGTPAIRAGDNSVITVTESPEASKIYAHDWTIQGAG